MSDEVDLLAAVERLNEIGIALSRERNLSKLLENILVAAKEIAGADAGTLYQVEDDLVRFEIVHTDSLGIALGGSSDKPPPAITIPLTIDGQPNNNHVVAWAVLHDQTVNIEDAYTAQGFDFSGTRAFDQSMGYHSQSFLTVPMKNHESEIIGVLQLINAEDPATGAIIPFAPAKQRLVESLASQAAIAITNRQLISQLEDLFESFIGLINTAIDDKSPYTGGHCQRVPELTMMLAEAVNDTTEGPFKDFQLSDKDRYELKIAGLLHDCGKVTTPVHVVDKATKLQTIFDRIHLLSTRFEVLKRDAEIAFLRGQCSEDDYQRQIEQYHADLEFLRQVNQGGEFMDDGQKQRVQQIANYQWTDENGHLVPFLSSDEVENLSISKGTLTDSEREIINHHIDVTIKMLESLPWPKHLKNVPEFAGGHHERMDGKGYPKGLTREQMSVQARIMGIADVFEALTARDRPYKPAMKLSTALKIMQRMVDDQHIDRDLFDVFAQQRIYLNYAGKFLKADQVDIP